MDSYSIDYIITEIDNEEFLHFPENDIYLKKSSYDQEIKSGKKLHSIMNAFEFKMLEAHSNDIMLEKFPKKYNSQGKLDLRTGIEDNKYFIFQIHKY